MTIHETMKNLGVEISSHYSDLYVPVTEETRTALKNAKPKPYFGTFRSNIDGKMWFDISFAFDPYWEKVGVKL